MNHNMSCPLCKSENIKTILALDSAVFDDSKLYNTVYVATCNDCGHIFNEISDKQYEELQEYYDKEYAPVNLDSPNKTGDMPGSNNKYTTERFKTLFNFIEPYIKKEDMITDVGCASGGFLYYLESQGYKNLWGIDPTIEYIKKLENDPSININGEKGSAEYIPIPDKEVDFLNLDQVLEHVKDPIAVFKEAFRVLKEKGIFCISVPDAMGYRENYIYDFYWFLLKEHLGHYDLQHLTMLANFVGFDLLFYQRTDSVMMSEKALLPNLTVLFCKRGNSENIGNMLIFNQFGRFNLRDNIIKYVEVESIKYGFKRLNLKTFLDTGKMIYIWGMGREFFYLYQNTDLIGYKNITLIDENIYKQNNFRVNNKIIYPKEILKEDEYGDSMLLITAIAHKDEIIKEAKDLGYRGEFIDI